MSRRKRENEQLLGDKANSPVGLLIALRLPFIWLEIGGQWKCNWGGWILSVDTEESGNDACHISINDGTRIVTQTYYDIDNNELIRAAEDLAIATRVRQAIRPAALNQQEQQ